MHPAASANLKTNLKYRLSIHCNRYQATDRCGHGSGGCIRYHAFIALQAAGQALGWLRSNSEQPVAPRRHLHRSSGPTSRVALHRTELGRSEEHGEGAAAVTELPDLRAHQGSQVGPAIRSIGRGGCAARNAVHRGNVRRLAPAAVWASSDVSVLAPARALLCSGTASSGTSDISSSGIGSATPSPAASATVATSLAAADAPDVLSDKLAVRSADGSTGALSSSSSSSSGACSS